MPLRAAEDSNFLARREEEERADTNTARSRVRKPGLEESKTGADGAGRNPWNDEAGPARVRKQWCQYHF